MISNRSGSHQSEFMQALVPMVDLFAVLAIVFMIHSNEEITVARAEVTTELQEARTALAALDELEQARRERRESMANAATMSLEEIREERERQAQELLTQVTEMLALQQSSAAEEYENILTRIENEHEEAFQREATSLEQQTQAELEATRAELAAQQEQRIEEAKEEFDRVISSTETELGSKGV